MALFISTYHNRVDRKGRVSVPAAFRNALVGQGLNAVVAYGSFVNPCVEACGMDRIQQLHAAIEKLDPFSEEHDAFATAILGGSVQLPFDTEGRIALPQELIDAAALMDVAAFVGKGLTFEIWNPDAYKEHLDNARRFARDSRQKLRSTVTGGAV